MNDQERALGRIRAWASHYKDESRSGIRETMKLVYEEAEAALAAREEPYAKTHEYALPPTDAQVEIVVRGLEGICNYNGFAFDSDDLAVKARGMLTAVFRASGPTPREAIRAYHGAVANRQEAEAVAREDTERPEGHRRWTLKQTLHGKHLLFEIEDGPALPIGECVDVTERANGPERELYLARREPPGMGLNVIDGAHSDEEGVARAAKLHARIFSNKAGEGPAVMVEVFPVPDLDPPINEDAADACREMVRDAERKPK